jgi:hypothetical protein
LLCDFCPLIDREHRHCRRQCTRANHLTAGDLLTESVVIAAVNALVQTISLLETLNFEGTYDLLMFKFMFLDCLVGFTTCIP